MPKPRKKGFQQTAKSLLLKQPAPPSFEAPFEAEEFEEYEQTDASYRSQPPADIDQYINDLRRHDIELKKEATRKMMSGESRSRIVGTCLEMCPELERYEREKFGDLSHLEMLAGTEHYDKPQVDHSRAVKKFRRSTVTAIVQISESNI